MVSVFVTTYNQEKYISKTIQSILDQETTFEFEVLIHDDSSSDTTVSIVREYEKKYPNIIKPIYQSENQFSQGKDPNKLFNYPRAKGKYIAVCEGDDYWCDKLKLQKQYDALEANPECSICVHRTNKINEDGTDTGFCFPATEIEGGEIDSFRFMKLELVDSPWSFHYSSFFFRKNLYEKFLTDGKRIIKAFSVGDKPLLLYMGHEGNLFYINQTMSCYRLNSGVMNTYRNNIEKHMQFEKRFIQGYKEFDLLTKGKYSAYIEHVVKRRQADYLFYSGRYRELMKSDYKAAVKEFSLKRRITVYIGSLFPETVYSIYLRNKE